MTMSMLKIANSSLTLTLAGYPKPQAFTLGGRMGNCVIKSEDKRVLKGWRVLSVDGVRVKKGAVPEAIAEKHSTPPNRSYNVTFFLGDEEPEDDFDYEAAKREADRIAAEHAERVRREEEEEEARRLELAEALRKKREEDKRKKDDDDRKSAEHEAKLREEREGLERMEREKAAAAAAVLDEERRAAAVAEKEREERRLASLKALQDKLALEAKAKQDAEDAARQAERKREEEERKEKEETLRRINERAAEDEAMAKRKQLELEQEKAKEKETIKLVKAATIATGLPPRASVAEPQKALLSALTKKIEAKKPMDVGPCDKCDGAHGTDRCPHFKEDRDKHTDAVVNYGKKGGRNANQDSGMSAAEQTLRNPRVVKQPGDGSCLFHSMAHGLKTTTHSQLRRQIAAYICDNPNDEIGGTPIKDWVMWDSGLNVREYSVSMQTGNKWGGAIEIAVCAKVSGCDVLVYERKGGSNASCISKFESGGRRDGKSVRLLYSGQCHYDAIA
jgi:hypothetical protein